MAKDRNNCTTASLQYKLIKSQFIRQQPVCKSLKLLLYVQRKVNGRRRHRFQKVAFCLSTRKRNGGVVRLSHFGTRSQKVSFSVTQNAGWVGPQNCSLPRASESLKPPLGICGSLRHRKSCLGVRHHEKRRL